MLRVAPSAGSLGQSPRCVLEKGPDDFKRGATTEFIVEVPSSLGELKEIDIGHDGSGAEASWHLESVRVAQARLLEPYRETCR